MKSRDFFLTEISIFIKTTSHSKYRKGIYDKDAYLKNVLKKIASLLMKTSLFEHKAEQKTYGDFVIVILTSSAFLIESIRNRHFTQNKLLSNWSLGFLIWRLKKYSDLF